MSEANEITVKLGELPSTMPEGGHVIRFGEAEKIYEPRKVDLSGTITAPVEFFTKRKEFIKAEYTLVLADYKKRSITLVVGEDSVHCTTVTGKLAVHSELAPMQINGGKWYKHGELFNLLKFKAPFFERAEEYSKLMGNLKAFEASINQAMQLHNDQKGKQLAKRVAEIKTNLDLAFRLKMPVWSHQIIDESVAFLVDIIVDIDGQNPVFKLESESLYEMIVLGRDQIFSEQLSQLEDFAIIRNYGGEGE
jgi:hypothetical protein